MKAENIDSYISASPDPHQELMQQLRQIIRETAPEATEKISWAMPTFYQKGNLVHFAALANHVGFYPGSAAIAKFAREFTGLKFSKGAVQFPLGKPLPVDLIKRVVAFRVAENLKK
jgi:uncharacterized protein YdhG (YjbR/CyaY superfamily)